MFIRLVLVLLMSLPALATAARPPDYNGQLRTAWALLAKADYARAYPEFLRQAEHNPLAQFTLGQFYQNGWGRPADQARACDWFHKAARRKVPTALHLWAECLMRPGATPADADAAIALYLRAAEGGHLISLCSAADLLIRGKGSVQDVARGLQLCAQAAQANSPPAMLRMARYEQDDPDVPRDLAGARYWYQQAAQCRVSEAQYKLAIMLSQGEGGAPDLPGALLWMENAASEGYRPAYLPTAVLYAHMPPKPGTGALSAEHLAKVYLWSSAATASLADPALHAQAGQLQAEALAVMPASWRADLDRQVALHLAKYPPSTD